MKANHSIMFFVIVICFCLIFTASAWSAEQKSGSGRQTTSPAAVTPVYANPTGIKKLPDIITIDKSLFARYQNTASSLGQAFNNAWKQVTDNYNLMPNKIAAAGQSTAVLNNTLDACGSKNFTQSDQKNAGCVDTDTLESCTKKLMSACIMPDYDKFAKSILDMAATLQKLRDAADTTNKLLPTSF